MLGTKGILCEVCDLQNNYVKTNKANCEKCKGSFTVLIALIGSFFVLLIFLFAQLGAINKKVNIHLMKIFLKGYFQFNINNKEHLPGVQKVLLLHLQIIHLSNIVKLEIFPSFDSGLALFGNAAESFAIDIQCLLNFP